MHMGLTHTGVPMRFVPTDPEGLVGLPLKACIPGVLAVK
jgi:hypothetical protein